LRLPFNQPGIPNDEYQQLRALVSGVEASSAAAFEKLGGGN
jgi:hypothetical protein